MVNEKSTKKQILDAYQASLDEIKKLKANQLDAKAEKSRTRAKEVKELTKPEVVDDVLETLYTLADSVPSSIQRNVDAIKAHSKKVGELEEAIKVLKAELKDLYDISSEAETMAALVDGHENLRRSLDEEIDAARKRWAEEKQEQQKRHAREAAEAEQAHSRRISEWEYEFDRHTKMKKDALEDQLADRKKEFQADLDILAKQANSREEALDKRTELLTDREEKVDALENKITELEEAHEGAVAEAVAAAQGRAKTSYAIEVNALKKSHEAEVTVLTAKVTTLEQQLGVLREDYGVQSAKLNEAYAKIQDVALKSLESQGNTRMVDLTRSMASEPRAKA